MADLATTYRDWLSCINAGRWEELPKFMHSTYSYNGKVFTPEGFAGFVEREAGRFAGYAIIVDTILADEEAQCLACRLYSRGQPTVAMFGCDPTGQPITFVEHHLVWFAEGRIAKTLYTLDIRSVRQQLQSPGQSYDLALITDRPAPSSHGPKRLTRGGLKAAVTAFFDCINTRTMASELPGICHDRLTHNGKALPLETYSGLVSKGFRSVPDAQFQIQEIVADEDAQLVFVQLLQHCTPVEEIAGLVPNGRAVDIAERSFYQFDDGKISSMWPLVDWEGARRQMSAAE